MKKKILSILICVIAALMLISCPTPEAPTKTPPESGKPDNSEVTKPSGTEVSAADARILEVLIPTIHLNNMKMLVYMDSEERPAKTRDSEWLDPEDSHIYICNMEIKNHLGYQKFYDNAFTDIPVRCYLKNGNFIENVSNAEFKIVKKQTPDKTVHWHLCISFDGKDYITYSDPEVKVMDKFIVENSEEIEFTENKVKNFSFKQKDSYGTTGQLFYIENESKNSTFARNFIFTYIYSNGKESDPILYNEAVHDSPVKMRVDARKGGEYYPYSNTFDLPEGFGK